MKFLVDAQLPISLSDWLCNHGHDSIHTLTLPLKNKTSDLDILAVAEREGRIILSKDIDFYDSFILKGNPKRLLMITTGNLSNRELLEIFDANLSQIVRLFDYHVLIELNADNLIVHR